MSDVINRYALDLTGVNPDNLVAGEPHTVTPTKRFLATKYGPFYREGLVVVDKITGNPLVPSVDGITGDYVGTHLYEEPTLRSSKMVCTMIFIINPTITEIEVTYQVVGGLYVRANSIIQELFNSLGEDDRPVAWGDIIGLPDGFPPEAHLHHLADWYGFEYLVTVLEGIRQAILTGDRASHEEIDIHIDQVEAMIKFATSQMAIEGTDTEHIITPFTLHAAMNSFFGQFDVELPQNDEPWGYFREPKTGFTICFGVGGELSVNSTDGYCCFFKRRFNHKPIVVANALCRTTDSGASGGSLVEGAVGLMDHVTSRDSFYYQPVRRTGTGSDFVKGHYIAVGYSDDLQPIAVSPGFVGPVPPSLDTIRTPIWSGGQTTTTIVSQTGTFKIGIEFASTVSGGGFLTNNVAQNPSANFFYTPYGGLFVDADYEVMCTPSAQTNAPNFTSIGQPLNTWVDLATMKAAPVNSLQAGFFWTVATQKTASQLFVVNVRRKVTGEMASRNFTLAQTSDAVAPDIPYSGYFSQSFNTQTGATDKYFEAWFANDGTERFFFNYGELADLSTGPGIAHDYGNPSSPGAIWANRSQYEIQMPDYDASSQYGYQEQGNIEGGQWYGLDTASTTGNRFRVRMVPNVSYNPFAVSALKNMAIRHKTDTGKIDNYGINLVKMGDALKPNFSGNYSVIGSGSGASGNYTLMVVLDTPVAGQGVLRVMQNGNQIAQSGFQYSTGLPTWSSGSYYVGVSVGGASDLTYTGPALGTQFGTLGTTPYAWQGTYGNPAVSKTITVTVTIRHRDYSSESSTQAMSLSFNKSVYDPGPNPSFSGPTTFNGTSSSPTAQPSYAANINADGTWSLGPLTGRWMPAGTPFNINSYTGGATYNGGTAFNSAGSPPVGFIPWGYAGNGPGQDGFGNVGAMGANPVGSWGGSGSYTLRVTNKFSGAQSSITIIGDFIGPDRP